MKIYRLILVGTLKIMQFFTLISGKIPSGWHYGQILTIKQL